MSELEPIAPAAIRYIKLGEGGAWETASLDNGEIHFGYGEVPHKPAQAGDWEAVRQACITAYQAKRPGDYVREIRDFYELGLDALWITFARGHLWWAFAEPEVHWLGGEGKTRGYRMRKTVGPWRKTDIAGQPLIAAQLSTRLTKTAAYRRSICRIEVEDYLLRHINAEPDPLIEEAARARQDLIEIADRMIRTLHWADFEVVVDLIFARSGWQRVSAVGGSTQKDTDLIVEQPTTGERAFVQVKSSADQRVLDDYINRFTEDGTMERLFFVCHSPKTAFVTGGASSVHVWAGKSLAEMVVGTGLFDWVVDRVS